MADELEAWGGRESPLAPGEWQHYRDGIESAIAGLSDARDVLEEVARRTEQQPQPPASYSGRLHQKCQDGSQLQAPAAADWARPTATFFRA